LSLRIGTSGWSYPHWDGVLYPPGTPPRDRLGYYLERFETVEVNSPFYRWPTERTFARWRQQLPESFRMAVKAPRSLTHGSRLYAPERWLERIERGLEALGEKRGPLLVQLPPSLEYDYTRLAYFLQRVPHDLQIAVEFRHSSWAREEVFALLEERRAAYCVMSGAGLPCVLRATAPFVYVRLHGPDPNGLYAGSYSEDDLRWWGERLREWGHGGREVFAYFNNDMEGYAVRNALRLQEIVRSSK
jgi:uncharacterized protein YecE (DUF72 family)